jgi:hypothetical protein
MESDDRKRSPRGVVVTLLDMGDGTSRLTMDDVISESSASDTSCKFDCFYAHKRFDPKTIDDMALPDVEYQGMGGAFMARLLALSGRVR